MSVRTTSRALIMEGLRDGQADAARAAGDDA
jgi:hypothetical protein